MRPRAAVLGPLAALAVAVPAQAGDPIMPLSDVHAGMHCTGYSVVRGTDISSFDVDVQDVVDGQPGDGPKIMVRVSGPAVDATGIGPGFSGSPVYCPDDQGVQRNIGAISETIGEFGGHTVLVTPIEQILGESPDPPKGTRARPRAVSSARPLLGPLTVSGVSPDIARLLSAAAKKVGRTLIAVPAGPLGTFAPQVLQPGAAVSIGYSSGDVALGAIGTVAYTDGDNVWTLGHSLDDAGARSLILQDAYVYSVINNPVASGDTITYKLAAPGHDLGMVTNDATNAVAGKLGGPPPEVALRILARDGDTGHAELNVINVADETALGLPTGASPLSLVGSTALAQVGVDILHSNPARQTATMCLRIHLTEAPKPLGFCNRYVGNGGGGSSDQGPALSNAMAQALSDYSDAITLLDSYNVSVLHPTRVTASLTLRRGLHQGFLVSARPPRRVRRGHTATVRATVRVVQGPLRHFTMKVHVPSDVPAGVRTLVLTGTPEDTGDSDITDLLGIGISDTIDFGTGPSAGGDIGPRSLDDLTSRIDTIQRWDGVHSRFAGHPGTTRQAFRDRDLRISGSVRVPLRVTR